MYFGIFFTESEADRYEWVDDGKGGKMRVKKLKSKREPGVFNSFITCTLEFLRTKF